jgi:pimeloyl-ACP methyl ester carboxylesterase
LFQVSTRVEGEEPPQHNDLETIQANLYENLSGIVPFVVPARVDIETATGGNASWNAGVDYRQLLRQASLHREVAALYRDAGLDLSADLDLLSQTADVSGDVDAINALFDTSVPTGRLGIPVLSMHTVADSLVPVQHEDGYEELVLRAGHGRYLRQAFVDRVGHCTFTTAEIVAAVLALDTRVDSGRWSGTTTPAALQAAAEATGLGPAAFVHEPARNELIGDRTSAVTVGR